MSYMDRYVTIDVLNGKTLVSIDKDDDDTVLVFETDDGTKYRMEHQQDCCERVYLEEIFGDLTDLLNTPILHASERTSGENPVDYKSDKYQDRFTWTFYELRTIKGSVTLRWYGESNGYYSESVDFVKV